MLGGREELLEGMRKGNLITSTGIFPAEKSLIPGKKMKTVPMELETAPRHLAKFLFVLESRHSFQPAGPNP